MNVLRFAAGAAALLVAAQAPAAGVHEGRWQYTMTMDMPGMPAMPKVDPSKLPPGMKLPQMDGHGMTMSFEHCVKDSDLVPRQERDECKTTKMDRKGNTVTWAAVCDSPQGKMNAEGSATYDGDTMTSTTHMTGTDRRGRPIDVTQKIKGRYLGPCTDP